jgi:CDP-diacylglycerol--glycerol-3-phosphate 3-phosphatidyltransferase
MLSVYDLKPKFQALIRPVAVRLNSLGVSPNAITISAVFLSAFMGYLLYRQAEWKFALLIVPILYLVRMMLNALDGIIANDFDKKSKLGEILNELGDVISDVVIFIGLLGFKEINVIVLICFISLSIINEFSGILHKTVYDTRTYHGPMGKSDRALIIGLFCILVYFFSSLELHLTIILIICCLLLLLSSYNRIK